MSSEFIKLKDVSVSSLIHGFSEDNCLLQLEQLKKDIDVINFEIDNYNVLNMELKKEIEILDEKILEKESERERQAQVERQERERQVQLEKERQVQLEKERQERERQDQLEKENQERERQSQVEDESVNTNSRESRVLYECARPVSNRISTQGRARAFSCNPINTPADENPDGKILTRDGKTVGGTFLNKEQCTQQCFITEQQHSDGRIIERIEADRVGEGERSIKQKELIEQIKRENEKSKDEFNRIKIKQEDDRRNGIIKTKEERNGNRIPSTVPIRQSTQPLRRQSTQSQKPPPRRQSTQSQQPPPRRQSTQSQQPPPRRQSTQSQQSNFKRPTPNPRRSHVPDRDPRQDPQPTFKGVSRERVHRDNERTSQRNRNPFGL